MILLAIVLIMLNIFKLYLVNKINWQELESKLADLQLDEERVSNTIKGMLIADGLISVACGIYILFI